MTEIIDKVYTRLDAEGKVPSKATELILGDLYEESFVLKHGQNVTMTDLIQNFVYETGELGAYWVSEGSKIKASKGQVVNAEMRAHKLAVFVPVTDEELNHGETSFENLGKRISKAFRKRLDASVITGEESPFKFSFEQNATEAGNVIKGELNEDNFLELEGAVSEKYEVTDYVTSRRTAVDLKRVTDVKGNRLYEQSTSEFDGIPVSKLDLKQVKRGTVYGVSADNLFVGIPRGFEYKIFDSGQISSIKNEDGTPINLAEQDMKALRVTFHVGVLIAGDGAVAKIEAPEAE